MTESEFTTLYTIGHSDRLIERFIELLQQHQVQTLVDVRANPYSKHHPQYQQEPLRVELEKVLITYHWAGRHLGGHRPSKADSQHLALPEGLRGYADYMESADFERSALQLMRLAQMSPTVIMCAERNPQHCHRSLIADYLLLQGVRVIHIVDDRQAVEHQLHSAARRESAALIYDRNTTAPLEI